MSTASCSRPASRPSPRTTGSGCSSPPESAARPRRSGWRSGGSSTAAWTPHDIVVALRRPSVDGPLFAAVLRELRVPVALEAELPLSATAVGRSLIALCRAAGDRTASPADLLAHLRADPSVAPGAVDWLERAVARREAESVDELAGRWENPPVHLSRIQEAGGPTARVLALADGSAPPGRGGAHRDRAAGGRALERHPARPGRASGGSRSRGAPRGAGAGRRAARLPRARPRRRGGSARRRGRARLARIVGGAGADRQPVPGARRARPRYLFCAAMQEGVFPGRGAIDPLLGEESRSRLGIRRCAARSSPRRSATCSTSAPRGPVERLYLSWRSSDEDGHPAARSPFVDEVLDLIGRTRRGEPELQAHAVARAGRPGRRRGVTTPRALARAVTRAARASTASASASS